MDSVDRPVAPSRGLPAGRRSGNSREPEVPLPPVFRPPTPPHTSVSYHNTDSETEMGRATWETEREKLILFKSTEPGVNKHDSQESEENSIPGRPPRESGSRGSDQSRCYCNFLAPAKLWTLGAKLG
ncbi:hypothetical protein Bbelb_154470 [Branchiostoma belcheri]|nr:hypothetical protein Bbelb_154470 [Branchiostoma belcheri]